MVPLGVFMAEGKQSVDPSKVPAEVFELLSIPAYDRGEPEIVPGSMIGSAKPVLRSGDVLLSRIVPHIRRSWVVGTGTGHRKLGSSEWIVFRTPKVDAAYLRHSLVSDPSHGQFMNTVSGVGGSLLRARPSYVAQILVPVPPIEEQRRIAAILDKADEIRIKRRAALAQLDTLTQSIFLDLFGDPISNPRGWPESTPLGSVAEIVSGVTKGRSLVGKSARSVPYLAVANVQDKALNLSAVKMIDATEDELRRLKLRKDDLVLTEGGDPDKLGRGCLWGEELPECIRQNHIFRVRIRTGNNDVDPLFLNWLIGSTRESHTS